MPWGDLVFCGGLRESSVTLSTITSIKLLFSRLVVQKHISNSPGPVSYSHSPNNQLLTQILSQTISYKRQSLIFPDNYFYWIWIKSNYLTPSCLYVAETKKIQQIGFLINFTRKSLHYHVSNNFFFNSIRKRFLLYVCVCVHFIFFFHQTLSQRSSNTYFIPDVLQHLKWLNEHNKIWIIILR